MAEVAEVTEIRARIDRYLTYLLREWWRLPSIAAEWDEWEDHDQLDFVVEWGIREDRLHQLRGWCEQGLLTGSQQESFEELLHIIERNRPTLERLLAD